MKTFQRNIEHCGYRLLIRNPEYDRRPSDKQRVPRFLKDGLFDLRDQVHDYLKRHFPTYTAKDYRIVGVKIDYTPEYYEKPRQDTTKTSAAEKITQAIKKKE